MKRPLGVALVAVLPLLLFGPIPNSLARIPGSALPAGRSGAVPKAIEAAGDTSAAYATGTAIHADALRAGRNAVVGLDVAFSGAAFSSAPITTEYVNEVQRVVVPGLGAKAAFGRGTGLELGLGSTPVPVIGQLSQAAAPPSTDLIEKSVGPIGVPGVLTAELLRSQAQSRSADGCVLSPDQAYGLGSVLELEVLGGLLATVARPPLREIVQSSSTTRIVPGSQPGRLALKSETRQTIAPVTFFQGSPIQFTVEVLGEWALRATADGAQGNVHYGPLATTPETPVVRILDAKGAVVAQLTTQMIPLLGNEGLVVEIPGVAEIAIGENPRLTGGDASTAPVVQPTKAVAAVDVVRVRLLDGALGDVRIGHMEAAVTVPAGGVQCPGLIVNHEVDKPTVTPGDEFLYTITVTNPHDCVLADVRLVDTPTLPDGVKLQVVSMTPPGGDFPAGVITQGNLATHPDLGPIGPGETKTVTIKVKVPLDSAPGNITAVAVATGVCPVDPHDSADPDLPNQPGAPSIPDIPVRGEDSVDGPTVGVCVVPSLSGLTPAEAEKALIDAGCTLGEVTGDPTADEDEVGKVIGQDPVADTSVPLDTPVDITVGGPLCTVPTLVGLSRDEAVDALEGTGCELGTVTTGPPGTTGDPGDISTQNPPAGDKVPIGTEIDVVIAPPTSCVVPNVTGMTQEQAAAELRQAGCLLGDVTTRPDANPDQNGKVVEQGTPPATTVPTGTEVDVTVGGPGAQVLGETVTRSGEPGRPGTEVQTGSLVRTGGVAFGALALWLMVGGLTARAAGSKRLWRLARRGPG